MIVRPGKHKRGKRLLNIIKQLEEETGTDRPILRGKQSRKRRVSSAGMVFKLMTRQANSSADAAMPCCIDDKHVSVLWQRFNRQLYATGSSTTTRLPSRYAG